MKKKVKIPVIVVSSVVGAILIAVIVLCSVSVRPLKSFSDYRTVRVTTTENTLPDGALTTTYKSKLDKNLRKTGFSVMHATLELVGSYGPKFETEKNDEGDTVRRAITIAEARSECAATEDSYMLEMEFALNGENMRVFKVGKEKIEYDRLLMNVHTTSGELRWVTVYLYRSDRDGTVGEEAQEYRVTPIAMRMNTSPLYIALGEIAADYTR